MSHVKILWPLTKLKISTLPFQTHHLSADCMCVARVLLCICLGNSHHGRHNMSLKNLSIISVDIIFTRKPLALLFQPLCVLARLLSAASLLISSPLFLALLMSSCVLALIPRDWFLQHVHCAGKEMLLHASHQRYSPPQPQYPP